MASLNLNLFHHTCLPSSSFRTRCSLLSPNSSINLPSFHRTHNPSLSLVVKSAAADTSVADPPDTLSSLKLNLLSAVSGLNRGLAANEDDLRKADDAAKELEAAGGLVDLSADIDKLQGRWKLIYSSAFSSRTLGGSRPGPPTGRLLPITLGQVFQRIDILSKDFDNIVEVQLGAPWPLPPLDATATLAHKFELIGCFYAFQIS
ncbi:Plastid-lipid-associated protein 6, chloroplastic, variant 2 [Stylosanthes scabra]|uniref:Plastid-lipid-associated protein 6, chloroplastic, variant 2 n=1 Tax=Stylosanthes scabra TaxID=79078 RepID=A0ABU6VDA8_9FABA|nr:Plastid-lipid-associated protein 6, chloroplastic, variant 2 [Stylosanthes scabra]